MNNKLFLIPVCGLILLFCACDKTKSYEEMVKEEKTAIERFIDENELIIVTDFPEGDFGEKVFYQTPEGLYMHIISKGTDVQLNTNDNIYVRFKGRVEFKNSTEASTLYGSPDMFLYDNAYSYSSSDWICEGITIPLQYVKYEGKVSLIVPSKLSTSYLQNYVLPVYYKEVEYTMDMEKLQD